jgi:signal transduction histidine kinase
MKSLPEAAYVRWRWAQGVRARLVMILVIAVILPNSLLAIWIARSARASAMALLEQQLDEGLADAARTIGYAWIEIRARLLSLGEDPRVLAALRDSTDVGTPEVVMAASAAARLSAVSGRIQVRDLQHRVRLELATASAQTYSATGPSNVLPVSVSLYDASGTRLGSLEASVSLAALLPPIYGWGGAAGSVPAIFASEGTPLVPISMVPLLRRERRFTWDGEEWLAAHRDVHNPSLRLALAAPTAPHTTPFTDAARRGVLGLVIVLGGSVLVTLLLSHDVSTSIGRLTRAAEEVAAGRLEQAPLYERGPDEVRRLERAFNTMTRSLQRLLRRVSQQESAAAVGEFAASLAHEVRNPLTSVRIDLERSRERLAPDSPEDLLVARAIRQVERLDATVSGALRIARSGSLELAPLDLREPVGAAHRTASALCAERDIGLVPWTPPEQPIAVRGSATAIEQMLLNLLINAADAVEVRRDVGGNTDRPIGPAPITVEVNAAGDAIHVRVRDQGRGMSAEERARALEPFYSTRPEGTGLGLTVVKRIADAHGAELVIESSPGNGTTVTVVFPRGDNGRP